MPPDQTYNEGSSVTVRDNTGSLHMIPAAGLSEAFKFGGWNTRDDGESTDYAAGTGQLTLTEDITLYAKWVPFELRDTGPGGGLIFFDRGSFSEGWRYMEAAPQSIEAGAQWGIMSAAVSGTGMTIGTGKNNTALIVTKLNEAEQTGRAAQLADALNCGGYDDWFLPSLNEVSEMCRVLYSRGFDGADNPDYGENRVGGFINDAYWSSSATTIANQIRDHIFSTGIQATGYASDNSRVRAARQF